MQFDVADAQSFHGMTTLDGSNLFAVIVTHEMLHSIGFGSVWSLVPGVVSGANFVGQHAVDAYVALGGAATGVPIEQDFGGGTAGSHWDEDTFHGELMTGFINTSTYGANTVPDPLSAITVASLWDLGYVVNMGSSRIDAYSLI